LGVGGHEVKSGKTAYGWKEDKIPDSYYGQVQHYMAVLGLPWFMVSVYILDTEEVRHYIIRRNAEFVEKLIAAAKDFLENYSEKSVMPAAIGIENEDDMVTGMFEGTQGTIRLGDAERELCAEYVAINCDIKALDARKHAVSTTVKQAIIQSAGDNLVEKKASAVAGPFSVSWSFFDRKSVNTEALKKRDCMRSTLKSPKTTVFLSRKRRGLDYAQRL
jgi:predicted phage-related endonuclease